jgi:hypothetical protein
VDQFFRRYLFFDSDFHISFPRLSDRSKLQFECGQISVESGLLFGWLLKARIAVDASVQAAAVANDHFLNK